MNSNYALQYRCTTDDSFIAVDLDVFNASKCGYDPNTDVSCWLRALNGAGGSERLTKNIKTECAGRYTAFYQRLNTARCPNSYVGFECSRNRIY